MQRRAMIVLEAEAEIKKLFKSYKKSALINPKPAVSPQNDGCEPAPLVDPLFIQDCAKIAAFLMDTNAVLIQLKRLDLLIKQKLSVNQDNKNKTKMFRELLEAELAKAGFHPKFGKTFNNIKPVIFRASIANGLLLKDAIIGGEGHGEFTHCLQWLLIAWEQNDTAFLSQSVITIFKRLGSEESVFMRAPYFNDGQLNDRREISLWDVIVDRFDTTDFRTPSALNWFIIKSNEAELAILKELLSARREKRRLLDAQENLTQSYMTPKKGYHKGTLFYIHEPSSSSIDLEAFKKESLKSTLS